jgi:photosystem II stability/assembly factor-like uncharacterized protein
MRELLLLFVLTVFLTYPVHSQTGSDWKWLHPTPQGNQLRAVQVFSASTWYAVGYAGTFMKTTDAGSTWEFNHKAGNPFGTSGQSSNAYDLHFTDLNNGLVVGNNSGILKTTDAGTTWTPIASGLTSATRNLNAIDFASDNLIGYVAGMSGSITKTTDGGDSWTQLNSGYTDTFYDIWTLDGTTVWATSSSGNLRKSTDGGLTWITVYTGSTFTVYKIDGDGTTLMAVGGVDNVRVSTDGGNTWTSANPGISTSNTYLDVDYVNNAFYLTGRAPNLYKSTNLGVSWDTLALLSPGQRRNFIFYSSAFSPTGDSAVTVGSYGNIQSRMGVNATPVAHTSLIKFGTWNDVWSSAPDGVVIAVGSKSDLDLQDQVARSTDGGLTWSIVQMPSNSYLRRIDMVDNNNGFISGNSGVIYKTTNSGVSWDSVAATGLPAGATWRTIDFVDINTGWVFAASPSSLTNYIYKTTDGGATWVGQSHGISGVPNGQVYAAHMRDANKGVLLTWEPVPYSTLDGGASWRRDTTIDDYTGLLLDVKMVDDSLGYMVGDNGRIYKTTNGGIIWDTLSKPTNDTYDFQSLEVFSATSFAVFGSAGTFLLTTDSGLTWTIKNSSIYTIYGSHFSWNADNNSFAWFAVGTDGAILKNTITVVPVELVSLSATVVDNNVSLNWKTATELNNKGFEIERKSGEGAWSKVSYLSGNGTSTTTKEYVYTDKGVKSGKYQYRLKQIDFDGSFSYSHVIEVEVGTPMTFDLSQNYPNPFNPSTTISYKIPENATVSLKIFDVTGTEVMTLVNEKQDAGSYTINFDAKTFASGMYIYTIKAGDYTATKKMMLMK